jgi:vacuolar-type H+-ATPase subunit C/Vma6
VDYTYLVARLRAIEAVMPDRAWCQRLARTPEDGLLGALREQYRGFEQVETLLEFEGGIESTLAEGIELVSALIPDRDVLLFLRAGYDFDNVVHAWKAKRLDAGATFNPFGLIEREAVEQAVARGDWGDLPLHVRAVGERLEREGESIDTVAAEQIGASAKWAFLLEAAPGAGARAVVRRMIDLGNVKTFIRCKRTTLRRTDPVLLWIEGGEIDTDRLSLLFREGEEELYGYLQYSSYRGMLRSGLDSSVPLWRIDPIVRRELFGSLAESRYRFFDFTPVLYHMELLKRNAELLRLVIVSKQNRLPEEMVLERLDAYLP